MRSAEPGLERRRDLGPDADELRERDRRTHHVAEESRQPLGAAHLERERGGMAQVAPVEPEGIAGVPGSPIPASVRIIAPVRPPVPCAICTSGRASAQARQ